MDSNSSVKPSFFLNCDEKVYWTIEKTDELKKSNVYDVEIQIINNSTKIINQITEKNLIHGANILFDFYNTDFIKIENEIYEIDKLKSTSDILFLKKPIHNTPSNLNYNPVLIKNQCIFLGKDLINKINTKIKNISHCDVCTDEQRELMCDLFALKRIEDAINCGDCDSAKTIFNNLKNKYNKNELC